MQPHSLFLTDEFPSTIQVIVDGTSDVFGVKILCSFLTLTNSLNSVNFDLYDKKHRPKKKQKNIYFQCESKNVSFVVLLLRETEI